MELLGDKLKRERKKLSLSIKDICEKTNIYRKYIENIENNNFSEFPAEVYARGYIKLYAETLHLNSLEIIDLYERSKVSEIETPFDLLVPDKKRWFNRRYLIISIGIIISLFLVFFYE